MNNKPISIIINETKDKIVQVCNSSGLPSCILELIIKNIYNDVYLLAERQLENDLLTYTNLLTQSENKESEIKHSEGLDES